MASGVLPKDAVPYFQDRGFGTIEEVGCIFADGTIIYGSRYGASRVSPSDFLQVRRMRAIYFDMKFKFLTAQAGSWRGIIGWCNEFPGARDFDGSQRAAAEAALWRLQRLWEQTERDQKEFQGEFWMAPAEEEPAVSQGR